MKRLAIYVVHINIRRGISFRCVCNGKILYY